jgi:hypothetical protein
MHSNKSVIWLFITSVADPGCLSRIPDPTFFHPDTNCFHPGSRILIKEFKNFNPKKWFLSSRKYDPDCSSRIRIPDPEFLPIQDPGPRIHGSQIRISNTVYYVDIFDQNGKINLYKNLKKTLTKIKGENLAKGRITFTR